MARPRPVQNFALQQQEVHDNENNEFAIIEEHEDRRWEQGFKVELPEFHGGQSAEELLNWIVTVEEILEFKRVPLECCVPLIAMRFRGTASAWWAQLKTSRARLGKPKILSWDKLKKKMRKTFLPFNYDQVMFKRFHDLRQRRWKSVTEYYTAFSATLRLIDLRYSGQQLVALYIGGLRQRIQDKVDLLNPLTVAEAHQHALTVEAQIEAQIKDDQTLGGLLLGFALTLGILAFRERKR